ncbi:MAG TPA: pectinesterase family protein [Gammaproteobacteria bacterium]|nr:pectinesterase family protein [Gammaproteobacteria bacterium]
MSSIDPSKLTYDILVDGNLDRDDPAKLQFKTLQAAYAAAQPGTEQKRTVIGIKPNLYLLPSDTSPSLRVTKNYITFLGLTNNRRSVVLADNRGLQQGADDNGYILDVDAVGFTLKNLTVINYCNTDYEYPGDPRKNLTKRSNVTTQAVALQASGDKHVYENVALLSRLDTMFLRTTRSYFKNVYIEGTDDWMGGGQISVWEDSTLVYPTGSGVMSASNVVFRNCRFEATNGMQFYKAEYGGAARPNVLIDSILPVASVQSPVAWVRGKAAPRPSVFSLTYHDKDAAGNPAVLYDSNMGDPTFTYSRELSDQEVRAYNPWNLLRATPNGAVDDWDPAGVKQRYETAGEGNLVYRMNLTGSGVTIRTGGAGTTLGATVTPSTQTDAVITWSTQSDLVSLDKATGPSVVVTARNTTGKPQWVPIAAALSNGFRVTAYVYAEPRYIDPPALTSTPRLSAPRHGTVSVGYSLDLGAHEDQSLVSWAICDDSACSNPRDVAVSRGNEPLKSIKLLPGFSGKFIKVTVQPKIEIGEVGAAVSASSTTPIAATAVPSANVSLNARSLVTDAVDSIARGVWTTQGPWSVAAEEEFLNGYGVRSGNGPAWILYQEDVERGDMQIDLFMTPEKTEGQGFSVPGAPSETGPRNLHSDVYIKYDPRTKNGYALRFWRTTLSASKVMFQLYEVVNGVGKPIDERQVLSGVLKPSTKMALKITGSKFTVDASNTDDTETLHLEGTIKPNRFGGAGVFWPGGSTNAYSRIDVSYAGN